MIILSQWSSVVYNMGVLKHFAPWGIETLYPWDISAVWGWGVDQARKIDRLSKGLKLYQVCMYIKSVLSVPNCSNI